MEYTKPEGPHPLEVQKLNPIYVWLVCLVSFFMLVAANGMVELYGNEAVNASTASGLGLTNHQIDYQKQKVSNGLGSVTILIIIIKILDKVYYRERLLPEPFFSWLDMFYKKAAEDERRHRSSSNAPSAAMIGGGAGTATGHGGAERDGNNNYYNTNGASEHSAADLRASSISSASEGFHGRASFKVVPKADVTMGIRRIRPLTSLKIVTSALMFALWTFDVATENYMTYNAALIVFPSFVEIVLEVRNFFIKQRDIRENVQTVGVAGSGANSSNHDFEEEDGYE